MPPPGLALHWSSAAHDDVCLCVCLCTGSCCNFAANLACLRKEGKEGKEGSLLSSSSRLISTTYVCCVEWSRVEFRRSFVQPGAFVVVVLVHLLQPLW